MDERDQVLAGLEAPIQRPELGVDGVEALEQRVELPVFDPLVHARILDFEPGQLVRAVDHHRPVSRPGQKRLHASRGAEVGERDPRQLLGRVGEDLDPRPRRLEPAERRAHRCPWSQVHGRALECLRELLGLERAAERTPAVELVEDVSRGFRGAQIELSFVVYQISAQVGRGFPGEGTVDV